MELDPSQKYFHTFSYWEGENSPSIEENRKHWSTISPSHTVYNYDHALKLLSAYKPSFVEAFQSIRIPACRSDVASLLILYAGGGLFLDVHCAAVSERAIKQSFLALDIASVVISTRWAPAFKRILPYNGVLWAHPRSLVVKDLLDTALYNMQEKYIREKEVGFEPFDIWHLTGPGVIWRTLFDLSSDDGILKLGLAERVITNFESHSPVDRYAFNTYRTVVKHWSDRQESELLFDH